MKHEEQIVEIINNNTNIIFEDILKNFMKEYVYTCLNKSKSSKMQIEFKCFVASYILDIRYLKELNYARRMYDKDDYSILATYLNKKLYIFNKDDLIKKLLDLNIDNEVRRRGLYIFKSKISNIENVIDEILKPTIVPRFSNELIEYAELKKDCYMLMYKTKMNDFRKLLKLNLEYLLLKISRLKYFDYYTVNNKKFQSKNEKYIVREFDEEIIYLFDKEILIYLPVIFEDLKSELNEKDITIKRENNMIYLFENVNKKILK